MRNSRTAIAASLPTSGAALIVLAGCAVGPDYHLPSTPVDAHYLNVEQPGLAEGVTVERY